MSRTRNNVEKSFAVGQHIQTFSCAPIGLFITSSWPYNDSGSINQTAFHSQ